jgi:hypothetical protein
MRNLFGGISPFIKLTVIKAIPVAGYKFHLARRDWAQAEDGVCGGEKPSRTNSWRCLLGSGADGD